jgi:D-alanyl-D-alanine carboxypeptidase
MTRTPLVLFVGWAVVSWPAFAADKPAAELERVIDAELAGPVKESKFAGVVLVAQNGKPLVRKAYGLADEGKPTPHEADTRFMIFSVSKQFTAALVLRLQDAKKLSVSDPVSDHVADWPAEWAKVTVHHLLTHSSGIDVDTLYFWLVKHHPQFWEDATAKPPVYEPKALLDGPGATFRYSNAGYTVLSLVAAKAGKKPFHDLMRAEVFEPLGLTRTGFEGEAKAAVRAKGYKLTGKRLEASEQKTHFITGAGDVVSTADDLLKWDEALYADAFLSADGRKAMFTPFVKGKSGGLGYGWSVRRTADKKEYHLFGGSGSGFTASVVRMPELHLYVAVLTNRESDGPFPYGEKVFEKAVEVLTRPAR